MKHIFKLLMITFLIASIGIVYAQDGIDKKKDEIVKENQKTLQNKNLLNDLPEKLRPPKKKLLNHHP